MSIYLSILLTIEILHSAGVRIETQMALPGDKGVRPIISSRKKSQWSHTSTTRISQKAVKAYRFSSQMLEREIRHMTVCQEKNNSIAAIDTEMNILDSCWEIARKDFLKLEE